MELEELRTDIVSLFDRSIIPYIIGDLNILDGIQPGEHSTGCTIPTAMLIVSTLDFIGYMLRLSGKTSDSEENIKTAFSHNKEYFPEAYTEEVIKRLALVYRHGMMHRFFPTASYTGEIYGIHKSVGTELFEHKFLDATPVLSLNVNVLSKDFKRFIEKLHNEIKTTHDKNLLERMVRSFKENEVGLPTTTSYSTTQTTLPPNVFVNKKKPK